MYVGIYLQMLIVLIICMFLSDGVSLQAQTAETTQIPPIRIPAELFIRGFQKTKILRSYFAITGDPGDTV